MRAIRSAPFPNCALRSCGGMGILPLPITDGLIRLTPCWRSLQLANDYENRLRIPLEGDDHTRFETAMGLHVATGYTRIVIGGRGPYIEFLPGQVIWENLHVPDGEKYRTKHPWKDRVHYLELRTNDKSRVKVYEQRKRVDYADYRVGLLYISPFDLLVNGEPVISKLDRKKKGANDVIDLFREQ